MKQFSSVAVQVKNSNGEYESLPALRGATPYEIAVRNGFKGTEDEWYQLSFDDGWVTKYQQLEADKANKDEVYIRGELDELYEKAGKIVPQGETTPYTWQKLSSALFGHSSTSQYSRFDIAFSPNGKYMCAIKSGGGGFTLYSLKDMSIIGSVTFTGDEQLEYGAVSSIEMDNDSILVYQGRYLFYTYAENGMIAFDGTITGTVGEMLTTKTRIKHYKDDTISDYFWFWSCEGQYTTNSTYYVNRLTKSTGAVISTAEPYLTNIGTVVSFSSRTSSGQIHVTIDLHRSGDDAIVLAYRNTFNASSYGQYQTYNNFLAVRKYKADGTVENLLTTPGPSSDGITQVGSRWGYYEGNDTLVNTPGIGQYPGDPIVRIDPSTKRVIMWGLIAYNKNGVSSSSRDILVFRFGSTDSWTPEASLVKNTGTVEITNIPEILDAKTYAIVKASGSTSIRVFSGGSFTVLHSSPQALYVPSSATPYGYTSIQSFGKVTPYLSINVSGGYLPIYRLLTGGLVTDA